MKNKPVCAGCGYEYNENEPEKSIAKVQDYNGNWYSICSDCMAYIGSQVHTGKKPDYSRWRVKK